MKSPEQLLEAVPGLGRALLLGCGQLCRGFARLRCEECGESRLVAFSGRGRGFLPIVHGTAGERAGRGPDRAGAAAVLSPLFFQATVRKLVATGRDPETGVLLTDIPRLFPGVSALLEKEPVELKVLAEQKLSGE